MSTTSNMCNVERNITISGLKNKCLFLVDDYDKCSKILNTFLFLFSNKMLVFRAGIHQMLVRIANREDPDQTASSEAV